MDYKNKTKENGPYNPHQRLHNVVFILVSICLAVQVLEGSFFAPYIFVHFGIPQLSLKEECDEMHSVIYNDPDRTCAFPYPLFKYEPEPWTYASKEKEFGYAVPPRPGWKDLGYKDFVRRREERLERQVNMNHQNTSAETQMGSALATQNNAHSIR